MNLRAVVLFLLLHLFLFYPLCVLPSGTGLQQNKKKKMMLKTQEELITMRNVDYSVRARRRADDDKR